MNLKKQTNETVLTKISLSVPRTNPFSEALFGVDNVVLFCYVQSKPLAVVKIHHGGYKLAAAVTDHDDLLTCTVGKLFEISLPVRLRESRTPGVYFVKSSRMSKFVSRGFNSRRLRRS